MINFEPIGEALKLFDTDLIDIYRRTTTYTNTDGTTGENVNNNPLYTNIACHLAFISDDNPNPETIDTKPKIVSLQINCDLSIDLQNNDYIIAKKIANDGNTIIATYSGTIGLPTCSQSRQAAIMQMKVGV